MNIKTMFANVYVSTIIMVLIFSVLGPAMKVHGASQPVKFSTAPASGTYRKGSLFDVSVNIDTGGMSVQAAQFALTFDPSKLKVKNFQYGDAIPATEKSLLADQEVINNTEGYVTAPAMWLTGYNGSGEMAKITFEVLQVGTAALRFADAGGYTNEAYETDGDPNTNVLGATTGSSFTLSMSGGQNTSSGSLPSTGITSNVLIGLGIILLLSGIVMYFRMHKTTSKLD